MNLRNPLPLALALICAVPSGAWSDDAPRAQAGSVDPWARDLALVHRLTQEASQKGIMAIEPHAAELEAALGAARQSTALANSRGIYLTDGTADTLGAMALAAGTAERAIAVANPYSTIAMYLGVYYDEVGRAEDALRVLDLGLALSSDLSDMRAPLTIERGAALMGLKRWDDVIANEDAGLKLTVIENPGKAKLYRGRGYALTELNRLDEAEEAYKESLDLEPGNELANHELAYIRALKAGAPRAPGGLNPLTPPAPPSQPDRQAPGTDKPDSTL